MERIEAGNRVRITTRGLLGRDKWTREVWLGRAGWVMRVRGDFADVRSDDGAEITVHIDGLEKEQT